MTAVLRGDPGLRNPTPDGKMDPRKRAAFIALEALLVIIAFAPVFVSAQLDASHLTWSIDCGSDRNYTDPITNINWTVDDPFIRTGENARNVAVVQGKDHLVNKRQLGTLRYFNDSSRTRHCYVLPVTPRKTYLVRPTFFLGNWMNSTAENIVFSLSINATWWLKMYFSSSASDHNRTQFFEAIVHSPGSVLNICLWPIEKPHIAFISTLELREFTTGMYTSASAGGYQYQSLHTRINPGPSPTTGNENLRYPDDPYDRIWWADGSYPSNQVSRKNNASGSSSSLQLQNKPPSVVMDDAWTGTTNQTFSYSSGNVGYIFGSIVIYIYAMVFDAISNSSNIMQYSVNGIPIGTFTASNFPQEIISSIIVPESNYTINFTLTDSSTVSILNAFEVYVLRDLDRSFTSRTDVDSITAVQKTLDLTNWTGDPCLPKEYPYEWLSCDNSSAASASDSAYTGFTTAPEYRITALHLNNLMMDATEIKIAPPEIASLTALNHLELKGNGFSNLSISLSQLKNLTWLDLSNNHFSGEVVQLLRSVGVNDNLQQLNLDGNGFTRFSSGSHSFQNLTTLNISNNRLEGNVMDFVNSISSRHLTFLYAANNSLQGRLSMAQLNQRFKDIREVDFDGQSISGTVNLSDWHLTWQSPGQNSSKRVTQLIKLRWNNITDVYPDLDYLSTSIKDAHDSPAWGTTLDKNGEDVGGVLLTGNPWCWTSDNKTLAHRYFCRHNQSVAVNYSSTGLPVPNSKDTNKTAVILGTTIGGCSLLICCIIILGIMWRKLRKKSRALSEIHEAFIKEKVHPPIYSYAELRTATTNFSSENNLGRGAFGAVYRGKLVNGTQVAVKKLFKESQVLDEFLNEAVLITGIKHRNLSQLKGCCIDHDQRILVYEYAENGNLAEALWGKSSMGKTIEYQNEVPLSWQKRLNICMGIARGLSYLHEELQPPIIHRDIKPANILIDRNFDAKIADFGLARSFLSEKTRADFTRNVAGTFGYLAPEYVTQGQLTEKADVFSFGVVLLEIVSGRKCIDESLPIDRVSLVHWASTLRDEGNVLDILDPSIQLSSNDEEVLRVVDIAFACLQVNPARRPTMLQTVARMHGDASAVFNNSRTSLLSPNELKKSSVDWFRLNPTSRHHHTLSH